MTLPACEAPAVDRAIYQLGLSTRGHELGGLAVVSLDQGHYGLTLLSPVGMSLFTVSGPPKTVDTGLADWRPWISALPIERDLRLLLTSMTPPGCALPRGVIRVDALGERRYHGHSGPATARFDGTWVLEDHRRHYRLLLTAVPS